MKGCGPEACGEMGVEGGEGVLQPRLPAQLLSLGCSPAASIHMTGRLLPTTSQLRVFCPSVLGDDLHWVIPRLLLLQKWVVFGECIRALVSAFQRDGLCPSLEQQVQQILYL